MGNFLRACTPLGDQLMSSRDLIPLRIAMEHPEQLLGGAAAPAAPAGGGNENGGEGGNRRT